MIMIIVFYCGAVLGSTIRMAAVLLPAASTPAATATTTTVFGWCAVLGGLCNPYFLFSLFTLVSRLCLETQYIRLCLKAIFSRRLG
jgi:hypothetical protein